MAEAVPAGLLTIGDAVGKLGCGDGKETIYTRGAWGWYVAKAWSADAKNNIIVFGPMMVWHYIENLAFIKENGQTVLLKNLQGPDNKKAATCSYPQQIGV